MDIELLEARDARLDRTRECMVLTGTTKDDYVALGFSAAQVRGWFARSGSSKARSPDGAQLIKIWRVFNWSPTYVLFGKGAKLLSQVGIHEDMFERMDRFQAVLQLALDEAEANKKRYHRALQTIENRDEQLFSNKQTLADFGVSLAAADKNVSSLSEDVRALSKKLEQALGKVEDTPILKQ